MTEEKKTVEKKMDAVGMINENAEKKTKIRYNDRITLEIISDTKYFKAGQTINPHRVMGERLIKDKIAKEVK